MTYQRTLLPFGATGESSRTAPYVPVLGPVHPSELKDELWAAVIAAGTRLLPYDKTRRWGNAPIEIVKKSWIKGRDRAILVHTSSGGRRLYLYSLAAQVLAKGVKDIDEYILCSNSTQNLQTPYHATRIFMDEFLDFQPMAQQVQIIPYQSDYRIVFEAFLRESGDLSTAKGLRLSADAHGTTVAAQGRQATEKPSPILLCIHNGQVRGAIGPLTVLADSRGVDRLLPCYFLVLPAYRSQGVGTALWAAMRNWAVRHGASYTMLQAEVGSAAESFYLANGLTPQGYVYTTLSRPIAR